MGTATADPLGLVGTTVDKYDIVSLAGEGGFSVVYRAEHRIWKQPVAIKFFTLLEDAQPALREHLLEDFVREGKLLSELSSRTAAILQARDIGRLERGEDRWIPYMVLEWLEGRSFEEVLAELRTQPDDAPSLAQSLSLLAPAAQALEVAHEQGIAHRDLKPANLMVVGDWRARSPLVKVLDFGIAKVMSEHEELQQQLKLTGAHVTAFTPAYGAPEQFTRTYGATGPWTDVYALALILVELMLGGGSALRGETVYDVGRASCDPEKRPTPRGLGLTVPDAVEKVFEKAVALAPADRYPTMGQFWSELCRAAGMATTSSAPELGAASARERPGSLDDSAGTDPATALAAGVRKGPASEATAPMSREPGPSGHAPGSYAGSSSVTPDGPTVAAMLTSITAPPAPQGPRRSLARWSVAGALLATMVVVGVVALTQDDGQLPAAVERAGESTGEPRPTAPPPASEQAASVSAAAMPVESNGPDAARPPAIRPGATPAPTALPPPAPATTSAASSAQPRPVDSGRGAPDAGGTPAASPSATESASRGGSTTPAPTVDPWDPSSFGGRR